ncbi:MAG TPA: hypothetical protein VD772_07075, partial [Anseongella sp.]|nr:hypothetical protein [Anseongella sp.]
MSDRSDKELSRHIQAVFDAYDEPFDAANWQRLQLKRRGRIAVFYLKRAGMAAAVALLLTTGVLLWNNAPLSSDKSLAGDEQPAGELPLAGQSAPSQAAVLGDGAAEALLQAEDGGNEPQAGVPARRPARAAEPAGGNTLSSLGLSRSSSGRTAPAALFPGRLRVRQPVANSPGSPAPE